MKSGICDLRTRRLTTMEDPNVRGPAFRTDPDTIRDKLSGLKTTPEIDNESRQILIHVSRQCAFHRDPNHSWPQTPSSSNAAVPHTSTAWKRISLVPTNPGRWRSRPVIIACCITTKLVVCRDCGRPGRAAGKTSSSKPNPALSPPCVTLCCRTC